MSVKDASFSDFKTKLEKAIKEKDIKFIESITDENISFAFEEGGMGKKKFLKYWGLDKNSKSSSFWEEISRMVKLGYGVDAEGMWTVPYMFNHYPEAVDPYSQSLVIGETVNIRTSPSKAGKIQTQLSWEFVQNVYDEGDNNTKKAGEPCVWKKICMSDGHTGYICDQFLRSPFDYRAGFQKKKNNWKMIFFTTGSD
jgi:hypothetical protein